jgi:low affinity Fe/Cu permease
MDRLFTAFATRISAWAGQPLAFVVALLLIVLWGATGPIFGFSDTWQLVVNTSTTIVTFLMVFVIQNSQNRDAAAMQAKLDEVIRAIDGARNRFIGIEHLSDREIEEIRHAIERDSAADDGDGVRKDTVSRLLRRR